MTIRTPEKAAQHPDPRWIDGRRIVGESQGTFVRADGKGAIAGIWFAVIETEAPPKRMARPT